LEFAMTRLTLLLPLALFACSSTEKDDTGGGTTTQTDACEVSVESTLPTTGAVDAYYRGDIEFVLSDPDATATIVTTIPGTQTVSADGLRVIWTLSEPLSPSTSYSATLQYCGGDATIDFTTSSLGTALENPDALVGNTYVLDLTAARIVEPPGIGAVLTGYLTTDILVGVTGVSATEIEMIGAIAVEDSNPPVQDVCEPTIDFPVADFSESPFFEIGPQDTTLSVAGFAITIGDLLISGTIAANGTYFDGGVLSGTIDTRPLVGLVDDSTNPDPNTICDLAVSFGAACVACPEDGEPYCLTLVADQIYAEQVDGLTLVEILEETCAQ